MAYVIGVHHDDQPGAIKFFMAVLGDTWFPVPDDSLTEESGWQRVSMSERSWQSYVLRHAARTRTDMWTGLPVPLNDDGTLKARE